VSNAGVALFKCWFRDDVEVECEFRQYINQSRRHVMAIIFNNEKNQAIGTNYGCRTATFSKGRLRGQGKGNMVSVRYDSTAKIKLRVKEGIYEAHRQGHLSSKAKYSKSRFSSGRVGFVWGGSMSGTIGKMKIRGKLDVKKTAEEFRGASKSSSKKKSR